MTSKSKLRAVLYVINTTGVAVDSVKLRRDGTIFGRQRGDVLIDDSECSSTHCQILNINDEYFIFDMNSTNGTFVNNEKIVKAQLNEGDIITLGKKNYRFALETASEVRNIKTVFKSDVKQADLKSTTIVDSLIESDANNVRFKKHIIHISATYHNGESQHFTMPQRVVFLGRASSFGRFDEDPEISRKHLQVKLNEAGEIFIEDLGSTNGTFLNNKKITGIHQVKKSDLVKIGLIKLTLWADQN